MMGRSLRAGLFGGALTSFMLMLPTWQLFIVNLLPYRPFGASMTDPAMMLPVLILSGLAFMVLCATPIVATLHPGSRRCWSAAAKSGAIAAAAATLILFIMLVFPTNAAQLALQVYREMQPPAEVIGGLPAGAAPLPRTPPAPPAPPRDVLQPVFHQIMLAPFAALAESLGLATVLGGMLGTSVMIVARRKSPLASAPAAPVHCEPASSPWAGMDILGALGDNAVRRGLWSESEEPLHVGLAAGLLYGVALLALLLLAVFASDMQRGIGLEVAMFAPRVEVISRFVAGVGSPLMAILLLLLGAVPIWLLGHPPSRLRSRIYAATVTAVTAGVIAFTAI